MVITFPVKGIWRENISLVTWKEKTITSWSKSHSRAVFSGEELHCAIISILSKKQIGPQLNISVGQSTWEHGRNIWRGDFWACFYLWGLHGWTHAVGHLEHSKLSSWGWVDVIMAKSPSWDPLANNTPSSQWFVIVEQILLFQMRLTKIW